MAARGFWDFDHVDPFDYDDQGGFTGVALAAPLTAFIDLSLPSLVASISETSQTMPSVVTPSFSPVASSIFQLVRHLIETGNDDEMMLVIGAGQSLSFGTTLNSNFETLWTEPVDADRVFMLDVARANVGARGWNWAPTNPDQVGGLVPMQSQATETPSSSALAQILAAYDDAGRIAPNLLHVPTGAIGASVLELMTGADDLMTTTAQGLARSAEGDVFAVARSDGKFDYFVEESDAAVYLATYRHAPGLWDTMTAQLSSATQASQEAGYRLHDTVAMTFIQGQSDAALHHATYGYAWAISKYLDMIEAELARLSGRTDLALVVSLAQVQGDADANVPYDQMALIRNDPRVHYGGTQWQFETVYGSIPGDDNIHLTPEGYLHLGQSVGTYLGQALLGHAEDPIVIDHVTLVNAQTLIVTFSGIEGHLISDPGIFTDNPDLSAPDAFGFALSDREGAPVPEIVSAQITGANTVRLTFDGALQGALRLSLGLHGQDLSDTIDDTAFESYNGTTLRDSEITGHMIAPEGYSGDTLNIYELAPIQYYDFWVDFT